jgi:hypothetical protein
MAKRVATVEDFQELTNELGMVPMQFLIPTITENKGDIRGAEPETALRWYNDGLAEPVSGTVRAKPASPNAGSVAESDEDKRKGAVEIAEGWDDLHHLQRVALAKQIAGNDDVKTAAAADQIIAAEIDRRAQVATGGPNAVTSNALRSDA